MSGPDMRRRAVERVPSDIGGGDEQVRMLLGKLCE